MYVLWVYLQCCAGCARSDFVLGRYRRGATYNLPAHHARDPKSQPKSGSAHMRVTNLQAQSGRRGRCHACRRAGMLRGSWLRPGECYPWLFAVLLCLSKRCVCVRECAQKNRVSRVCYSRGCKRACVTQSQGHTRSVKRGCCGCVALSVERATLSSQPDSPPSFASGAESDSALRGKRRVSSLPL